MAGSDRRRTRNRPRPGASAVVDRRQRSLRLAIAPPVPTFPYGHAERFGLPIGPRRFRRLARSTRSRRSPRGRLVGFAVAHGMVNLTPWAFDRAGHRRVPHPDRRSPLPGAVAPAPRRGRRPTVRDIREPAGHRTFRPDAGHLPRRRRPCLGRRRRSNTAGAGRARDDAGLRRREPSDLAGATAQVPQPDPGPLRRRTGPHTHRPARHRHRPRLGGPPAHQADRCGQQPTPPDQCSSGEGGAHPHRRPGSTPVTQDDPQTARIAVGVDGCCCAPWPAPDFGGARSPPCMWWTYSSRQGWSRSGPTRRGRGTAKRCDQENFIGQVEPGVNALRVPLYDLVSNWAYMLIAAPAWNLKSWFAMMMQRKADRREFIRMEFRFLARHHPDPGNDHPPIPHDHRPVHRLPTQPRPTPQRLEHHRTNPLRVTPRPPNRMHHPDPPGPARRRYSRPRYRNRPPRSREQTLRYDKTRPPCASGSFGRRSTGAEPSRHDRFDPGSESAVDSLI